MKTLAAIVYLCFLMMCTLGETTDYICEHGFCHFTCRDTTQVVLNQTITWPTTFHNNSAISVPLCLNENFQPLRRACWIGIWSAAPDCAYIQQPTSVCPNDLTYSQEYNLCYKILEPDSFPPKCPYPEAQPFYDYVYHLKQHLEEPIWMPVHRNVSKGIGELEWIEMSGLYGNETRLNYYYRDSIVEKDCLIYHNVSFFEAVYCNDSYHSICAYLPLQSRTNSYCHQKYTDENCTPVSFNSSDQCFCTKSTNSSRDESCDELAEFKNEYQNTFPGNETCWIGLEKSGNSYVWSKSKEQITYSFWSNETDFRNTYGALKNSSGWTLENNSLSCAICTKDVYWSRSSMLLGYDTHNKLLTLLVYNPSNLKRMSSTSNPVSCFTDANLLYFKTRLPDSYIETRLENFTLYNYNASFHGPGYYWCEAFEYPDFRLVRSNAILVHDRSEHGNEYAVDLTVKYEEDENPTLISVYKILIGAYSDIPGISKLMSSVRQMKILALDESERTIKLLAHLTAQPDTGYDSEEEFEVMLNTLNTVVEKTERIVSVDSFLSSHYCFTSKTEINGTELTWGTTPLGYISSSSEVCILSNGQSASRNCSGDFIHGAKWSQFNDSCTEVLTRSLVTDDLLDLWNNNHSSDAIISNLTDLTEYYEYLEPFDIYIIASLLKIVNEDGVDLTGTATIVDNVMKSNKSVLVEAQTNLNATNKILYYFDQIAINSNVLDSEDYVQITKSNTVLLVANLSSGIEGITLFSIDNNVTTEILYNDTSLDEVINREDFLATVIIPNVLMNQILTTTNESRLVITVYFKDSLFHPEVENVTDAGNIFTVLLPGFEEAFEAPLTIIFKPIDYLDYSRTCGYWQFRTNRVDNEYSNAWATDSNYSLLNNDSNYLVCKFWHVTHFALLVLSDADSLGLSGFSALDIITDVNCSLSMLGFAGIIITALLFKSWRRNTGNQVLINFVVALCLQIVVLYISVQVSHSNVAYSVCILIGILLHYSTLSQFFWMLVIAILQFKRFVQVFGGPPKWVLMKACIVGWVFPVLPVICLIAADLSSYASNTNGLCYPAGSGLYLAVLLPIAIIWLTNFIIYIIILNDVFYKKTDSTHCLNSELILQWRLVVLLFFMLGITWGFALLAYIYESLVFIYLFCFTATLQGFVLFMFFIVFNKSTRMLYVRSFKKYCFKF